MKTKISLLLLSSLILCLCSIASAQTVLPAKETSLVALYGQTCALKSNGTVLTTKNTFTVQKLQANTSNWTGIVQISGQENHLVGLRKDGTVVATGGTNEHGENNVNKWTDIVQVEAGFAHTVGLKKDGTVVAIGSNSSGQLDVSDWSDIVRVAVGGDTTFGIKKDGSVIVAGYGGSYDNLKAVSNWKNIVDLFVDTSFVVGLKKDGTLVTTDLSELKKDPYYAPKTKFTKWTNIVQLDFGNTYTVGLKKDGTAVAVGLTSYRNFGQMNVQKWKDIVQISANAYYTVGLKKNGTVLAIGSNDDNEYTGVNKWTNIRTPNSNKIVATKPPVKPTNLIITGKGTTLTLTWSRVAGADYYFVYYKKGNGTFSKVKVTTTTKQFTGLEQMQNYTFKVTAGNFAGESGATIEISKKTSSNPKVIQVRPTIMSVKAGSDINSVVITFSKPMSNASIDKVFPDKLSILTQWYYSGDHGAGFLLGSIPYDFPEKKLTTKDLIKMSDDKTKVTINLKNSAYLDGKKRKVILSFEDCKDITDTKGNKLLMNLDSRGQFLMSVILNPKLSGEMIDEVEACKRLKN